MAINDSIKWHIDDTEHELSRSSECPKVFIYKRGDGLPQLFCAQEALTLRSQIKRIVHRTDFDVAKGNDLFGSFDWCSS